MSGISALYAPFTGASTAIGVAVISGVAAVTRRSTSRILPPMRRLLCRRQDSGISFPRFTARHLRIDGYPSFFPPLPAGKGRVRTEYPPPVCSRSDASRPLEEWNAPGCAKRQTKHKKMKNSSLSNLCASFRCTFQKTSEYISHRGDAASQRTATSAYNIPQPFGCQARRGLLTSHFHRSTDKFKLANAYKFPFGYLYELLILYRPFGRSLGTGLL